MMYPIPKKHKVLAVQDFENISEKYIFAQQYFFLIKFLITMTKFRMPKYTRTSKTEDNYTLFH